MTTQLASSPSTTLGLLLEFPPHNFLANHDNLKRVPAGSDPLPPVFSVRKLGQNGQGQNPASCLAQSLRSVLPHTRLEAEIGTGLGLTLHGT